MALIYMDALSFREYRENSMFQMLRGEKEKASIGLLPLPRRGFLAGS